MLGLFFVVRRVPSILKVVWTFFSIHPVYVSSEAHEVLKIISRNSSSVFNDIRLSLLVNNMQDY